MTFIEVERPYRIVAAGRGGKFNRNKTYTTWTLSPSGGGTRVEHTTETEPQAADRPAHGGVRHAPLVQARRPQGAASGCSRSSRRTTTAARAPRSRASRIPAMRRACSSSPPRCCARSSAAGCGNKQETRHARRHRGHLPRRRRPEVPGADLALHEPERRRGPVLPGRPARRRRPQPTRRRDLVRRLHPRAEHDRRDDRAGQRLRDRRHAGERLPADPAGHEHQPVRLQAGPDRAQEPDPRGRLRRLRGHRSRARCCSSRSRPSRSRTARSSSASSAARAPTGVVDLDV